MPRVLGISGSLRRDSLNTELLRLAAEELPEGVELDLWDGLRAIPPYDADLESDAPAEVLALVEQLEDADAVLFSSPEYNGSIPGQLKNALDWVSRQSLGAPLRGKPVAVIGGTPGQFGGVWGHGELRKVLGIMGAHVGDIELSVSKIDERLVDPDDQLRSELRVAIESLVPVPALA
jgi:chromate reductase, NAD(P)H dehydrogenase (quinone)